MPTDEELKKFFRVEEWDYLSDPSGRYVNLNRAWRETLTRRRNDYFKREFYHTHWAWRDV